MHQKTRRCFAENHVHIVGVSICYLLSHTLLCQSSVFVQSLVDVQVEWFLSQEMELLPLEIGWLLVPGGWMIRKTSGSFCVHVVLQFKGLS